MLGHIQTLLTGGIIKEGLEEGGREEYIYFPFICLLSWSMFVHFHTKCILEFYLYVLHVCAVSGLALHHSVCLSYLFHALFSALCAA